MMKVQVIGLPGAGKSTAIQEFLNEKNWYKSLRHLDIRHYKGLNREQALRSAINNSLISVIAESACGVSAKESIIIQINTPISDIYLRLLKRDGVADEDYLSLLQQEMMPPDYRLSSSEDLPGLLKILFKRK